ncbi:MAG: prepilin-type N-terminal cleavage/methylation domain-containing protein [Opitutales bacterium]
MRAARKPHSSGISSSLQQLRGGAQRVRGFTIIELVTAIGVVAILFGILMTQVLPHAFETAKMATFR